MILTKGEILKEIKKKNITIDPFDESLVGVSSIDLRLGNTFWIMREHYQPILLDEKINFKDYANEEFIEDGKSIILKPNQLVMARTKEHLKLSPKICAQLDGRGRFARMGLGVHITSSFAQPDTDNFQTLEITNNGPYDLALVAGVPVCQLVFFRCD